MKRPQKILKNSQFHCHNQHYPISEDASENMDVVDSCPNFMLAGKAHGEPLRKRISFPLVFPESYIQFHKELLSSRNSFKKSSCQNTFCHNALPTKGENTFPSPLDNFSGEVNA